MRLSLYYIRPAAHSHSLLIMKERKSDEKMYLFKFFPFLIDENAFLRHNIK